MSSRLITFLGNFEDGEYEGPGICYFANGHRFEGNYANSERIGLGTAYFNDGEKLELVYDLPGEIPKTGILYLPNAEIREINIEELSLEKIPVISGKIRD